MKGSSKPYHKNEEPAGSSEALQNELESILANRIDEDYITSMTGIKDLSRIEYISIQIDTSLQSLFDLTDLLPNMKHLVLDNSVIGSIRDLGVGLRHLTSLSLSGCGLRDLDGIGVLTGLQELNLSDNHIVDISPLTLHEHLQNLNLGGNKIIDLNFGSTLASCPSIRALFLSRNPIERVSKYRSVVAYLIPTLEMLDGIPIEQQLYKKISSNVIEDVTAELKLIEEEIEEEGRLENDIYGMNVSYEKKLTVSVSNSVAASNPAVSCSNKGSTSSMTSSLNLSSSELIPDTGSELTHGSAIVLAGNVAAAMRKRRNHNLSEKSSNSSTYEDSKEFESALEVLDSALLNVNSDSFKENTRVVTASSSTHFSKEGDITDHVLGPHSPTKSRRQKSVETNQSGLELNSDYLKSPIHKLPVSSTKSDMMIGDPNSTLISATRRPQSAFTGITYRFSEKSILSSTGDNFSPRPSSGRSGGPPSIDSNPNSTISSPRQRNSSRPQSAANPSLFDNLKFTFNNTTAHPQSGRRAREEDADDDSEDDEEGPLNRYHKIVPIKSDEKPKPSQQKGSSIVHLDIVKRNKSERLIIPLDYSDEAFSHAEGNITARSGTNSNQTNTRNNSDVEQEDSDEDIAINHHDRFRLMSAAAARPATSNTKARHNLLLKLQAKPPSTTAVSGIAIQDDSSSNSGNNDEEEDSKKLFKRTSVHNLPSTAAQEKSNSSQIGMTLGFNLAGSLAAIDQWVHDMSSGEDEEDDSNGKKTKIQIVGLPNYSNLTENTSSRVPALKEKILSRDTILTMCTNSSNPTPRGHGEADESLRVEEGRNSRSSSKNRNRSASRRPIVNDPDSSFDLPKLTVKERSNKPAISSTPSTANPTRHNKIALVQKKHLMVSDNDYSSATVVSTPDFEERIVETTVPLTSASTSTLLPTRILSQNTSNLPMTAQSMNSLGNMGKGTLLSNEDIIELLRKPPKSVPMLRTKTSFQEFFKGIDRKRFESLLQEAYSDIIDAQEKEKKILRRLDLMEGTI